jgi:hypothetical protein
MEVINFLFRGTWGYAPKPLVWFIAGLLAAALNERGTADGTQPVSWYMVAAGTVLAGFSLWLSMKDEK